MELIEEKRWGGGDGMGPHNNQCQREIEYVKGRWRKREFWQGEEIFNVVSHSREGEVFSRSLVHVSNLGVWLVNRW